MTDNNDLFSAEAMGLPDDLASLEGAKAAAEDKFLGRANVVGVGVGYKISHGDMSSTPSVMVLVTEKVPDSMLSSGDKVTKTVDSKPTDVLEVGHVFAGGAGDDVAKTDALAQVDAQTLAKRVRPVRPGYSVGHPKVTAGTIGAGAYDITPLPGKPPRYYILSNNHVLANSNDANPGDPIYQPGVYDGGGPADAIGRLARFVPIRGCRGGGGPVRHHRPGHLLERIPHHSRRGGAGGSAREEDGPHDPLHHGPGHRHQRDDQRQLRRRAHRALLQPDRHERHVRGR